MHIGVPEITNLPGHPCLLPPPREIRTWTGAPGDWLAMQRGSRFRLSQSLLSLLQGFWTDGHSVGPNRFCSENASKRPYRCCAESNSSSLFFTHCCSGAETLRKENIILCIFRDLYEPSKLCYLSWREHDGQQWQSKKCAAPTRQPAWSLTQLMLWLGFLSGPYPLGCKTDAPIVMRIMHGSLISENDRSGLRLPGKEMPHFLWDGNLSVCMLGDQVLQL